MLPVELSGVVAQFKGNGRKLGYPTANIKIQTDLADGVYFGFADLGDYQNRPALIFVGVPTTVGDEDRRVEVHLLDVPDQDYYDQEIRVVVEHYHRPTQTFETVDKLKEVMHDDEAIARRWFGL
jgi:riboflavin kinase/FMN adenylyltransferase